MNNEEKNLCKQLYLQKISYDFFLEKYPSQVTDQYLLNELKSICLNQDAEGLGYILLLAAHHGYTDELGKALSETLIEGWHREHEDIARVMQFRTPVPDAIVYLSKAIEIKFDYLFEQDDYYPFVRKCLNAIRSIGTKNAQNALKEIVVRTRDQEIKRLAEYQLAKM